MSHRTQIVLTDTQYDRLKRESVCTGVGLGELIRRAVDAMYGDGDGTEVVETLPRYAAQFDRLRRESKRSGVGMEEMIRRAIATTYGQAEREAAVRAAKESAGIWSDWDVDSVEYVDTLRPGLARRLENLGW